jgi:membrane protein DedA with SNARE-associated domain
MKVLGIFVFILILSSALSVLMDVLLGFSLSHSITHLFNPFRVIEAGEYVMIVFVFLLTIGQQIMIIKKNKAKKNGSS